jgi:uncharacterized coiled-coil DUF342 family protein
MKIWLKLDNLARVCLSNWELKENDACVDMLKGKEAKEAYDLIEDLREQLNNLTKANSQLRNKVCFHSMILDKPHMQMNHYKAVTDAVRKKGAVNKRMVPTIVLKRE